MIDFRSQRVFLDVNILLDILVKREPLYKESYKIFLDLLDLDAVYMSSLSVHIIMYFSKKYNIILEHVKKILKPINILSLDINIISKALDFYTHELDFEDLLQYISAWEYGCKYVLTRNIKDFNAVYKEITNHVAAVKKLPIIISPKQALRKD